MIYAFLVFFAALGAAKASAAPLSLDDYLAEVNAKSPVTAAAQLHEEGGESRAGGAAVITAPYLFGAFNKFDDQAPPSFPAVQGTETKGDSYSLGVGITSPWGFDAKYSWNTGYTNVIGIAFPTIGNYTSYNKLDFTLNLVKNGGGSEVRARQEIIRAGASAQSLSGGYQLLGQLSQAEAAYWRLALARRSVAVNRDTLARSSKLLEWAKRRVSLQLGDKSDLLQAQANYDLHTIELSAALEEERNSGRAFNLLRNQAGAEVQDSVDLPTVEQALAAQPPSREGESLNVRAAAQRTLAAQAQSQLDKDSVKPSVNIVAGYAWNGRNTLRGDAITDALNNTHPTKSIGANFTLPLDLPTWTRALHGTNQEMEAAGLELDQTRIAETRDWSELESHLAEARARLKLTGTLEEVQREKFENERQRLLRGRTTTYQTLTFEQDYASSQLQRLRTEAELLQIIAQMKTYRGKP